MANKARMGADEDIRPCIGCQNGCMARVFNGGLVTCAVNPKLFYEKSDPVTPAEVKKHVVVIGGGLVGCETAVWLARKGVREGRKKHELYLVHRDGDLLHPLRCHHDLSSRCGGQFLCGGSGVL